MWYKIIIPFNDSIQKDQIIAWLDNLGIDSILEEENHLEAFTDKPDPEILISSLCTHVDIVSEKVSIHQVEDKNWNAIWESSFNPIVINGVCIRAPFHSSVVDCKQEIIIKPKMAFGTGHHETTSMMINYMAQLQLNNKSVFDFGCGTGILSVYAALQGSQNITGVDIQVEAIENSYEHVDINSLERNNFQFKQGGLDLVKGQKYDLILANINRHVLEMSAEKLSQLMNQEAILMCSGILKNDESLITSLYSRAGFNLIEKDYQGEWCLFVFNKGS